MLAELLGHLGFLFTTQPKCSNCAIHAGFVVGGAVITRHNDGLLEAEAAADREGVGLPFDLKGWHALFKFNDEGQPQIHSSKWFCPRCHPWERN